LTENSQSPVRLEGWWRFDTAEAGGVDSSGHGHTMTPSGGATWIEGGKHGGAYTLDGATRWLSTDGPVARTDQDLSVAAWVQLDSALLGGELALPADWYAVTAASQDGPADAPSNSPFYLGVRLIDHPLKSGTNYTTNWNFTASPALGTEHEFDWVHAYSRQVVQPSELDEWVLLVGVYDLTAGYLRLYVPGNDDEAHVPLPANWPKWRADGPMRLGQARFRGNIADQWPGSVGQVRVYSGALTKQDAASLYARDIIVAR
jgi:Concanavalin A-like lectin/glucanases superfamily